MTGDTGPWWSMLANLGLVSWCICRHQYHHLTIKKALKIDWSQKWKYLFVCPRSWYSLKDTSIDVQLPAEQERRFEWHALGWGRQPEWVNRILKTHRIHLLLHWWLVPDHGVLLAELANEIGFTLVPIDVTCGKLLLIRGNLAWLKKAQKILLFYISRRCFSSKPTHLFLFHLTFGVPHKYLFHLFLTFVTWTLK